MTLYPTYSRNMSPGDTWNVTTVQPSTSYLLIVSGQWANIVAFMGLICHTGSYWETEIVRSNIVPTITLDLQLQLSYNPPAGVGAQWIYASLIKL